ncbi:hypothetical protein GCM10009117_12900 [Gangjinia marincola]|uniref:Hypervirulence associated protein TUDOR domain-containing protein n=1 Tax=Gangjinia marincola TaxID=578463 RepID=A0ABN1MGB7_9FLAO
MIGKGTVVQWKTDDQTGTGEVKKTFHSRLAKSTLADPLDLKSKNQRLLYIKQHDGHFIFKSEVDVVKRNS